jgi:CRISPR-associated protein Csx1
MKLVISILPEKPNSAKYEIDHQTKEGFSPAAAFLKNNNDARGIYFAPESLIVTHGENKGKIVDELNDLSHFKKIVTEKFALEQEKIEVIYSVGTYEADKDQPFTLKFENKLDNTIIQIFFKAMEIHEEFFKKGNIDEVVVDVSRGHNVYSIALLEAIRAMITFLKLRTEEHKIEPFKILYCPPVPEKNASQRILPVFSLDYDVEVSFDLPEKIPSSIRDLVEPKYRDKKLLQTLEQKFGDEFGKLKKLEMEATIAFNSVKYNAPLCMLTKDIVSFDISPKECFNILQEIFEFLTEEEISDIGSTLYVRRKSASKDFYFNALYSDALYEYLSEWKSSRFDGSKITLRMLESFEDLYVTEKLGLNKRILKRDLEEIERLSVGLNKGKRELLDRLYKREERKNQQIGDNALEKKPAVGDEKRNFFAHSGLGRKMVYIERDNDILINYESSNINLIKKWISKPED